MSVLCDVSWDPVGLDVSADTVLCYVIELVIELDERIGLAAPFSIPRFTWAAMLR